MTVLEVYAPVEKTEKRYTLLKSGRDAGKSKFMGQLATKRFFELELDILVCRASYGDLQKSMFQEIVDVIEEEGLTPYVELRTRPLKILNKLNGNTIYFEGVGGADLSRTKGFKPSKKLSLILFDETQQLPSQSNYDQALASFRRHLDIKHGRVVTAFNPEPQNSHWMNEYYRIHKENSLYLCLHTSYKDIAKVLSDVDLEAIELEKMVNPSYYKYLYLGETNGLFGGVYHTFNRDFHLLEEDETNELIKKHGIFQILIGVDGATTRDATAVIPVAILNNGQAVVLEYLYHNPIKYGALDNSRLYPYIMEFIEEIEIQYDLKWRRVPMNFIVDGANADLIQVLNYNLDKHKYRVWAYTQKKVIQMAQIMQNAFSKNVLFVKDNGGIKNYISKQFEKEHHPLVTALESVMWDEAGKGFDSSIPNDTTDALTYALSFYFVNPNNIYFPKREGFYTREKKEVNSNE